MRAASMRARWSVPVAGLVVALVGGCGGGSGEDSGSGTAQKASSPSTTTEAARLSSGDLQGRWWTWATSEPEATNPVADTDGGACAVNQPDDVWFLAGSFGTKEKRSCPVPAGVPVAFPLVNMIASEQDCADFMSTAKGSAVLDGEAVEADRYAGETITVTSAEGNPVTAEAGTFTATGCGLWVQLPALSPGAHTLKIRGSSGDFSTEVDYSLAVAAR
ncbi:signal protein [Streptomyces cupreus]|uniref:Signal protein n=1 Tax=Streptomyces cupreus TaxID=2759956 RepID=A0A7X1J245_9ACTN|nr:signal protein [Streptomyces cupreus]MBC2902808.1 signal protein [Streptomyces cupreus]